MMEAPLLVPFLPSINSSVLPMDYNNIYNGSNSNMGMNMNMNVNMMGNMNNMMAPNMGNMNMANMSNMANMTSMTNMTNMTNMANMANVANVGMAGVNSVNAYNGMNMPNQMNLNGVASLGNSGTPAVNHPLSLNNNNFNGNGLVPNNSVNVSVNNNVNTTTNMNLAYSYGNGNPNPAGTFNVGTSNITLPASSFVEKVANFLPAPPLAKVPNRVLPTHQASSKRNKRKSKFTRQQDEMIISLKQKGKNWVEIAEITKVGSYLAARNRYQVIIGQQGNNNLSSWSPELNVSLKKLLDKYEIEKWKFITSELNKIYNKNYSYKEVQILLTNLFVANPYSFGINDDLLKELIKERKMSDRENYKSNEFDEFLNYQMGHEFE